MNSKLGTVLANSADMYSPSDEGTSEDFCFQEYSDGGPSDIMELPRAEAGDFIMSVLQGPFDENHSETGSCITFRIAFNEEIVMDFRFLTSLKEKEQRIRDLVAVMSGKRCIKISTADLQIDMGTSL